MNSVTFPNKILFGLCCTHIFCGIGRVGGRRKQKSSRKNFVWRYQCCVEFGSCGWPSRIPFSITSEIYELVTNQCHINMDSQKQCLPFFSLLSVCEWSQGACFSLPRARPSVRNEDNPLRSVRDAIQQSLSSTERRTPREWGTRKFAWIEKWWINPLGGSCADCEAAITRGLGSVYARNWCGQC